jgi:DNA-directed RNA polymerase specialized sigma24 family protein
MDVFARVCEALREDDLRRLRAYVPQSARFSTWLVTVVHRLTIDWFRHREGRRRLSELATRLPPLQRRIFELVFLEQHSHVAAYEQLRSSDAPALPYRDYVVELRATYHAVGAGRRGGVMRALGGVAPAEEAVTAPPDPSPERSALLDGALASLDVEDRLLLRLYVEEELPAADIARILGLANAKAVYNRAYRALAALRSWLERAGIRSGDL